MECDDTDRLLIGGEPVSESAGPDVLNPAPGEVITAFAQ